MHMIFLNQTMEKVYLNKLLPVVSYFFIKTACLFNTPKLLEFLNNNFTELNYDNSEEAKKELLKSCPRKFTE